MLTLGHWGGGVGKGWGVGLRFRSKHVAGDTGEDEGV